jgi:hypothetical protein
MFSCVNYSVEESSVERNDYGIDQNNKKHLVNLQSRISKYFLEEISVKYRCFSDQFNSDSPETYDFFLEEGNFFKISVSLNVVHRMFGGHWRGVPSPQQESFQHPGPIRIILSMRD